MNASSIRLLVNNLPRLCLVKMSLLLLGALLLTPLTSMAEDKTATSQHKAPEQLSTDQLSFALGYSLSNQINNLPIQLNRSSIAEGFKSGLGLTSSQLTTEQIQIAEQQLQQALRAQQQRKANAEIEKNTQEGLNYLATYKQRDGVLITDSGIHYEILRLGAGKKPLATDRVEVHYRGTFVNGDEFDSSYKRNQTATFGLNQVIPGWTEIVQLMPVGSKFRVAIPGNLAYGSTGRPGIGPNRTLLFDIELISIK